MPKAISAALKNDLKSYVTTIATLWKVQRRDGVTFHFTDSDQDVVVGADTYKAAVGYERSAIEQRADMSVDNLSITGLLDDDSITEVDLRAGRFDGASVWIRLANWAAPTHGVLKLKRGTLGEVALQQDGSFSADLRGMAQPLVSTIGDLYTPDCRADLGDLRCKKPIAPAVVLRSHAYAVGDYVRVVLDGGETDTRRYGNRIFLCTDPGSTASSAPSFDTTVGNTTTDGGVVWETVESWTRTGEVTALVAYGQTFDFAWDVVDPRDAVSFYVYGVLTWESGNNTSRAMEVKAYPGGGTPRVTLFLPMPEEIQVGDRFRIYPGCDKMLATCRDKFDNVLNMRAEPFCPGNGVLTAYPNQANTGAVSSTDVTSPAVPPSVYSPSDGGEAPVTPFEPGTGDDTTPGQG